MKKLLFAIIIIFLLPSCQGMRVVSDRLNYKVTQANRHHKFKMQKKKIAQSQKKHHKYHKK